MTQHHKVVDHDQWMDARRKFLDKEKAFTRLRDELNQQRRDLPWEKVEKEYVFEGASGKKRLVDLFDGRNQLVVYHFMFGPDWNAGCSHCSFWADNFDRAIVHLNHRDTTMVAISRAPYKKLAAYEKRMGWGFTWLSSGQTDFNFDFQASFRADDVKQKRAIYNYVQQDPGNSDREGLSAFFKDEKGHIFHTYSTYARGIDIINTAYNILDLTAKGRDEGDRGPFWVHRHDEYES